MADPQKVSMIGCSILYVYVCIEGFKCLIYHGLSIING